MEFKNYWKVCYETQLIQRKKRSISTKLIWKTSKPEEDFHNFSFMSFKKPQDVNNNVINYPVADSFFTQCLTNESQKKQNKSANTWVTFGMRLSS